MGIGAASEASEPRAAARAIVVDAEALENASLGFHRAFPHRSAKRRFYATQIVAAVIFGAALFGASRQFPSQTVMALQVAAVSLFTLAIFVRLLAAAQVAPFATRLSTPARWPTYTILCPLYREANVVADLIAALRRLDYPIQALDIKFLCESGDDETVSALLTLARDEHMEVVVAPPGRPRTKPRALNLGLARARGEFVVVYDAEDRPHVHQLRAALAAFEDGGAQLACVQAPLAIDNADDSWVARQFAAEYAIQFNEVLPLLARANLPLPLGGTSNHFRVDALRAAGGWDPHNVTEDADIGYRLARERLRVGMIAPPTWEEAPVTFGAWFNQRTRWIKGHMQTWLVLMRDPIGVARQMGLRAFAATQLMLGGGLAAAFVHGPLACVVLIAALSPYDLLGPAGLMLALSGYCVAVFAALTATALSGNTSHLRAALTMPFYWPLSSLAAARAALELLIRPHHWSKTQHGLAPRDQPRWAPATNRDTGSVLLLRRRQSIK